MPASVDKKSHDKHQHNLLSKAQEEEEEVDGNTVETSQYLLRYTCEILHAQTLEYEIQAHLFHVKRDHLEEKKTILQRKICHLKRKRQDFEEELLQLNRRKEDHDDTSNNTIGGETLFPPSVSKEIETIEKQIQNAFKEKNKKLEEIIQEIPGIKNIQEMIQHSR